MTGKKPLVFGSSCQSNPAPLPGQTQAFDFLLCPGSGELDLCLRGEGNIEPEVSSFKGFVFSGAEVANSYKTCLDAMEEFTGGDVAFVSDWHTKRVFKRLLLKIAGADDNCSLVGYDRQIQ